MESANHLNNRKSEKSENENGNEDSPNELILFERELAKFI